MDAKLKELRNKLCEDYIQKKINRKEICEILNVTLKDITKYMLNKRIKIWDNFRKYVLTDEILNIIISAYTNRQNNLKELALRYNLNYHYLRKILMQKNIEFWSGEGIKHKKNNNDDVDNSKFYFAKKDRSRYAKMFYEYNK